MFSTMVRLSGAVSSTLVKFQMALMPCLLLGNTENDHIDMIFSQILGKRFHIENGNTFVFGPDKLGLDIESCLQVKAPVLEREVAHESLTDIADADKNGGKASVHTEDRGDLRTKRSDLISIALLTEFAEAAKVLPDLRRGKSQLAAKLTGGNAADTGFGKFIELSQITGQTADDIVRDFDSFHGFISLKISKAYRIVNLLIMSL